MGCTGSKNADTVANSMSPNPVTASPPTKAPTVGKEAQIALAFKAKRANVFTESVDTNTRRAFKAKVIPKSAAQEMSIREFIFPLRI